MKNITPPPKKKIQLTVPVLIIIMPTYCPLIRSVDYVQYEYS